MTVIEGGEVQRDTAMDEAKLDLERDTDGTDRNAILMMLTYVAAECRRLGSEDAARHASMAATLIQGVQIACPPKCILGGEEGPRLAPLH